VVDGWEEVLDPLYNDSDGRRRTKKRRRRTKTRMRGRTLKGMRRCLGVLQGLNVQELTRGGYSNDRAPRVSTSGLLAPFPVRNRVYDSLEGVV
jgi:hypothetical protein